MQRFAILNNGQKLPLLGLGTCTGDLDEVEAAVKHALKPTVGYRHIDTARMYKNEQSVGRALTASEIPREDIWLTSKLDNCDHVPDRVAEACREQLRDLQTAYLDLYLIHWPLTDRGGPKLDPPIEATWRAMERLVDEGLVKSIGVSNFSTKKLKELQSFAQIQPSVNQVEVHCWHRNEQLVQHCKETGVHITAYSPTGGNPDYTGARPREDPVVLDVAKCIGRPVNQVLLKWNLMNGRSVIPKSTNAKRIEENAGVWDWELSPEHFSKLSTLKTQVRMGNGAEFLEKSPYRSLQDLWDGE